MIKIKLRHSLCFVMFSTLLACGPRGSASDPLPLSPTAGTGTGYPEGTPSRINEKDPVTDPTLTTPTTTPITNPTTGLTINPDTSIPTTLAPSGGDITAQIASLAAIGTEDGLEVGAWNIENYPKSDKSKALVSQVLNKLDVDVMGVEEINNSTVFHELLKEMPKFSGIIAGEKSGHQQSQNVGVIYRTADFNLVSSEDLFAKDSNSFPRPPLLVRLASTKAGRNELVVIVVHLKAFGDDDSAQRRQAANVKLQAYAAELKQKEPSLQIVILGDFNQPLLDVAEREVFRPWYDDADDFTVKTDALVAKKDYSFFGGQRFSFIDHIISSNNFTMNEPMVPKLQTVISDFEAHASDHLPVIAKIVP